MAYCKNCGDKYEDENKFCKNCGVKLEETVSKDYVENSIESPISLLNADDISKYHSSEKREEDEGKFQKQILNKSFIKNKNIINIPKIIFIMIPLVIIAAIFFIATYITNKSHNALSNNISIEDYFPKEQVTSVYHSNYGFEDKLGSIDYKYIYPKRVNDKEWEITCKTTSTGEVFNGGSFEYLDIYQTKDEYIKQTYAGGGPINVSRNISSIILCNKPQWRIDDESTAKITGTNLNISTKAGEFYNCIEITKETTVKGEKYPTHKIYYAPNIGMVMELIQSDKDKTQYMKWTELANTTAKQSNNKDTDIKSNVDADIKERNINNKNEILYINEEYKFNISIPKSWEGQYVVKQGNWTPEAEKILDFNFVYDNKEYGNIFSIIILKKNLSKGIDENYGGGMWQYVGTKDDNIFMATPTMQLPELFHSGNYEKEKNMLIEMVNEDVPKILKTFNFKD